MSRSNKVIGVDLFCGAGGASEGLKGACADQNRDLELLAINHWEVAIETHSLNHPYAKHLCTSLDGLNPKKVTQRERMHILVAGPECTHHARARGGKPRNDQSRASAWIVLKWLQEIYIDCLLIENVPEFMDWGPLGTDGKPLKKYKGETFKAYIHSIESLGYKVEYRILNCADYGDATTRERLFIMGCRGRKSVTWPRPSHSKDGQPDLFGPTQRWRAAREIIDWNLQSQSIFERKKPLAASTLERISAGLRKFCGSDVAQAFMVVLRNNCDAVSLNNPVPTIAANGNHIGLCQFVLQQQSGGVPRNVDSPLPSVATKGAISLVEGFLIPQNSDSPAHSVNEPMRTLTTTSRGIRLIQPYLVKVNHGNGNDPKGDERRAYSVDKPLRTLTTKNGYGLVEPFITKYYGTAKSAQSLEDPLDTVTSRDRFGLVEPILDGEYRLDIRFRMLQPRELAGAHSLDHYRWPLGVNKSDVTKMVGNSWPARTAKALCSELLQ